MVDLDVPDDSSIAAPFSEAQSWHSIAATWKQLYGGFANVGVSFEWHEFQLGRAFDWDQTFHRDSLELCLNLQGTGRIFADGQTTELAEMSAVFYSTGEGSLEAERLPKGAHRFITIEFSRAFLKRQLAGNGKGLHATVAKFLQGERVSAVSKVRRLTPQQAESIRALQQPPVCVYAQVPWYMSKALEFAALYFFEPGQNEELFCHRQKIIAEERVEKVIAILRENIASPPPLQEIAQRVGCSPFYLSRTFSKEVGSTIPQYMRKLRMEKAAELLKSGKFNVTEAALEVGYSSLSHFSQAFHEIFGCCPGLFPLSFPIKRR